MHRWYRWFWATSLFLAWIWGSAGDNPRGQRGVENDAAQQSVTVVNEYLERMENTLGKHTMEEQEMSNEEEEEVGVGEGEEDIEDTTTGFLEGQIRAYAESYLVDKTKRVLNHMFFPQPERQTRYSQKHYYQYSHVPYRPPPSKNTHSSHLYQEHANGLSHHDHVFAEALWLMISLGILLVALTCLYRCFSGTIAKMFGILYTFMGFVFFMAKAYHFYSLMYTEHPPSY